MGAGRGAERGGGSSVAGWRGTARGVGRDDETERELSGARGAAGERTPGEGVVSLVGRAGVSRAPGRAREVGDALIAAVVARPAAAVERAEEALARVAQHRHVRGGGRRAPRLEQRHVDRAEDALAMERAADMIHDPEYGATRIMIHKPKLLRAPVAPTLLQ